MTTDHQSSGRSPTPVFGLLGRQLQPVVERIAGGEAVASFSISIDHQLEGHYGYGADKLIPTISYVTQSGQRGEATVFVKLFREAERSEARHYVGLANHGAPISRLFGALTTGDGREMIFLEYLEPVVDFMGMLEDRRQFEQLLSVAARFNAVTPTPEYAATLPRRDFARELSEVAPVLARIWQHGAKGDIGDDLRRLCSADEGKLDALRQLAARLVEPIAGMDVGLLHNDFYPDSVAWHRETGELLVVDLESVGLGPRFYDVARWLGAPDEMQYHASARGLLAERYLGEYEQYTRRRIDLHQFLVEARSLWLAGTLTMLFFFLDRSLDGRMDWTDDRAEGRRQSQAELYEQVKALLCEAERPS